MTLPEHSKTPFEVLHLEFAVIKKNSEGVKKTQAFLLCIDECTRMVAAKPDGEDASSMISLLNRDMYRSV